jgi:hypothetical protein
MKQNAWQIVKKDDGTFSISHRCNLLRDSIPEKWLEQELARYGFCGEEYHQICRDIELRGRADILL